MLKAILFDLDNTIIDFMKMTKISCEEAVDAMIDAGLKMEKKDALRELYNIYFEIGLDSEKIFDEFLTKVNGDVDYKILAHAIVAYRKVRDSFMHPYPGTRETLMKLREQGYKLAIVTDAPKLKAWIRLATMKIDDMFDIVISHDDTGKFKPSKIPFKLALEKLNFKPEECMMVGDRPERDLIGAQSVGILTCLAKYGSHKPFNKVFWDYEIEKFEDLLLVVNDISKLKVNIKL